MESSPDGLGQQRRIVTIVALLLIFLVLLGGAIWSTRDVLAAISRPAGLGPADAPAVVTAITGMGTLIGAICLGLARLIRADAVATEKRGKATRDEYMGRAEVIRAQYEGQAKLVEAQARAARIERGDDGPGAIE